MITIEKVGINLKGAVNIPVCRPTLLGNPFKVTNESQRDWACDSYEFHFYYQMDNCPAFKREVEAILELSKSRHVNLQCHCYPKRCHAETIKHYLSNMS